MVRINMTTPGQALDIWSAPPPHRQPARGALGPADATALMALLRQAEPVGRAGTFATGRIEGQH